jgi:DNA-binding NtrC family response regulator
MPEPPRILVVDDEPNIRLMLRTVLETVQGPGPAVDEAADGETAVALCERTPYDAVFLDLRLPGIDGLEVLRRVRAHRRGLRVCVVTAHGTVDAAVEAMKLGAWDFVQKPFDPPAVRDVATRMLHGETPPHRAQPPGPADEVAPLLADARRAARASKLDEAEQLCRRALALAADRADVFHLLGAIHEVRGDRLRAQVYYRTALALDPTCEPARRNLGRSVGTERGELLLGDEPPRPSR